MHFIVKDSVSTHKIKFNLDKIVFLQGPLPPLPGPQINHCPYVVYIYICKAYIFFYKYALYCTHVYV